MANSELAVLIVFALILLVLEAGAFCMGFCQGKLAGMAFMEKVYGKHADDIRKLDDEKTAGPINGG